MARIDGQNRAPKVEKLPDFRLRVTRVFDVVNDLGRSKTELEAEVFLEWGTEDAVAPGVTSAQVFAGLRLTNQTLGGQNEGPDKLPLAIVNKLTRVYEEIPATDELFVGEPEVDIGQDGLITVVENFLQFSTAISGVTPTYGTPGVTTAAAPWAAAKLITDDRTDDGTLQRIVRTYKTSGITTTENQTQNNGALLIQTVTSVGTEPSTPSGYTVTNKSVQFVNGMPVYTYTFAKGSGQISLLTEYVMSPDQGTTGLTVYTYKYLTDPSVVAIPTTAPSGSQLSSFQVDDQNGNRLWTVVYTAGQGAVNTTQEIRENGNLIITKITQINAAPTAPSALLGGTVFLISKETRNGTWHENGVVIYEYTWAEGYGLIEDRLTTVTVGLISYYRKSLGVVPTPPSPTIGGTLTQYENGTTAGDGYAIYESRWFEANGQSSISTRGEPDGALVYEVEYDNLSSGTPGYPGSGTGYLIELKNVSTEGRFRNIATWKKPPASTPYHKQMRFPMPGQIEPTSPNPGFILVPPVEMEILALVTVDFATSQVTTAPFTVSAWPGVTEAYIAASNGQIGTSQRGLSGYLSAGFTQSGGAATYNGLTVSSYSLTVAGSTPNAPPSGATTISVDNDPYLTDITGVRVYKRTVATYSF